MSAAAATLPAFDPRDPLSLDGLLDDEERLIRDTVRQYVREKFLPHVAGTSRRDAAGGRSAPDLGSSGCSACTSRATAARARRRRRTG